MAKPYNLIRSKMNKYIYSSSSLISIMKIFESAKNYFIGSYAEMTKVTWPTKSQTINYSLLVIALSIGMAVFFAALDYIFNLGIEQMLIK